MNSRISRRPDTTRHSYDTENTEQIKRRKTRDFLKKYFRMSAGNVARKKFGIQSPMLEIIMNEDNCTKEIVTGISRMADEDKFRDLYGLFLDEIVFTNKSGMMEAVWRLGEAETRMLAVMCSTEIFMTTENEKLTVDFVGQLANLDYQKSTKMMKGIMELAKKENVHTVTALAAAFTANPEKVAEITQQIVDLGHSDLVLYEVVNTLLEN